MAYDYGDEPHNKHMHGIVAKVQASRIPEVVCASANAQHKTWGSSDTSRRGSNKVI